MNPSLTKRQINAMDYEALLRKWRFTTPETDWTFCSDIHYYFEMVMNEKKDRLSKREQRDIEYRVGLPDNPPIISQHWRSHT